MDYKAKRKGIGKNVMKKNFLKKVTLLIAMVLVFGLCACGKKSDEKKFVVGFDANFPPYGYMDDKGEYVGFDLDLAEEVCERNGWRLVKQPINWDSKDFELE